MELDIKEDLAKKMVFSLKGEGHTFSNLLASKIRQNSDTKLATYRVRHPLLGTPEFLVETTNSSPRKVLGKAAEDVKKEAEKARKLFEKL